MPQPDTTIDLPAARDVIKPEPLIALMRTNADARPFIVAAALNYFFELDSNVRDKYLQVAHINRVENALHELTAVDTSTMSEQEAAEIEARIIAMRNLYASWVREHDEKQHPEGQD